MTSNNSTAIAPLPCRKIFWLVRHPSVGEAVGCWLKATPDSEPPVVAECGVYGDLRMILGNSTNKSSVVSFSSQGSPKVLACRNPGEKNRIELLSYLKASRDSLAALARVWQVMQQS